MTFPLLLISLFCLLYLLLFLYSLSCVRCEMHLCLREAAGAASGSVLKSETALQLSPKERKAYAVDAAELLRDRLREAPICIRTEASSRETGVLLKTRIFLETETWGNPFLILNHGGNKKLNSRKYRLAPAQILRLKNVLSDLGEGLWGDPADGAE